MRRLVLAAVAAIAMALGGAFATSGSATAGVVPTPKINIGQSAGVQKVHRRRWRHRHRRSYRRRYYRRYYYPRRRYYRRYRRARRYYYRPRRRYYRRYYRRHRPRFGVYLSF
ncbi:MAG: hypothetical protein AAFQ45_03200 [Pseudomonadota bacterium]